MPNKNKNKGKNFERKISKMIREYWNLTAHECYRAVSSGTFEVEYSDIIINPDQYKKPHIIIECKLRNDFTFNKLLYPKEYFKKWFKQIENAKMKYKNEYNIEPIGALVYSANNMRPLIALTESDYKSLLNKNNKYNIDLNILDFVFSSKIIVDDLVYQIYFADEFFKNTTLIKI